MTNRSAEMQVTGPNPLRRERRTRGSGWRHARGAIVAWQLLTLAMLAAPRPGMAQGDRSDVRRIVVSLVQKKLWLIEGADTLLAANVAVGRRAGFRYAGKRYDWSTPAGERTILAKRRNPVWNVPQWHYYERAANEHLEVVELVRGKRYPLKDGSHLEVRGSDVVRFQGDVFYRVPQGRELIIDGVLYVPPVGTVQRRVPGVLGTRALDMGGGYLIHGTNPYNASSVGTAASHGCVRMETADVEKLFEMVDEGTPVLIY